MCALAIAGSVVAIALELGSAGERAPPLIAAREVHLADGLDCAIYLPEPDDARRPHALVFASSPTGDAREVLRPWKPAADRFGWIVVASNNYRNGRYSERDAALQLETLAFVKKEYLVDHARVYVAGLSGAAMHAYDIVGDHPELFRGVIANTGVMPYHLKGNEPFDAKSYPRGKVAVMLASPSDFRYADMRADRALLEAQGWTIDWLEFEGGHTYAPPELYVEAAAWLAAR